MYYIIIAKSFISGTFTDRQTGKSLDYSGWRIVAEEWHDGAKNPSAVKLFKLHKDCDAVSIECGEPCILQTQAPFGGNGLSTITGVYYK